MNNPQAAPQPERIELASGAYWKAHSRSYGWIYDKDGQEVLYCGENQIEKLIAMFSTASQPVASDEEVARKIYEYMEGGPPEFEHEKPAIAGIAAILARHRVAPIIAERQTS